ncbi:DUF1289 domain-containing protein [Alloalcanivorax sp. C16-2]|uniref:DUF1289 domain-containing protein n=1 Tax=Alloalcanivorax TaxID=3020832 RepID=UPI00193286C0|nr:DUF1289 domain-containing protein [Alloalcanivorax marinus]MBL7251365.1 DUF1289 domain-containing protein [Alloalcanivorax marinus]
MSASRTEPVVVSPCVSICALDGDDICVGCFRTGREISYWGRLTPAWQREVLARCQRRMDGDPAPCAVAVAELT